MSETTLEARPAAQASGPVRRGWLLVVLLVGQFMAILDTSIVNVAGPTIRADLHASGAELQFVIAGYIITYAMLLITGARLGDLLGHRRMFLAGLAAFTAASLACGLSVSVGMLIGFRFVQGAGSALMVPQVMSLIQREFDGAARTRALSAFAAVIAGAVTVGQVAGGALVGADLFGTGWRPVFLVNVPIGVVLLAAGLRSLPHGRGRTRSLDLPGLVTLSVATLLFVVPLVLGHETHWPMWGWVMLTGSGIVFAGFVVVERRASAPLVPARVLRAPGMAPSVAAIFACLTTYGGFLFTMALHLQGRLGESPLHAGASFLPATIGFAAVSLNWQRLPRRWHRPMIPIGFVVAAVGYLLLTVYDSGVGLEVAMGVIGAGLATFTPLLTLTLSRVAFDDAADASGLLVMVNQLGQVVGVAAFGTIYLGMVPSANALTVTAIAMAMAAGVALSAGCALLLRRERTS